MKFSTKLNLVGAFGILVGTFGILTTYRYDSIFVSGFAVGYGLSILIFNFCRKKIVENWNEEKRK